MKLFSYNLLLMGLVSMSCTSEKVGPTFSDLVNESPHIEGKQEYLDSPYVTAGNRLYMVGHQDGSFPELGWHIKGEMGGIWNHPIKLMDGFDIELRFDTAVLQLDNAESFTNYPYANVHRFHYNDENIKIQRWQFVPDDTEGIMVQLEITNTGEQTKEGVLQFTGHADLRPTWLGERTNMVDGPDNANYNQTIQGWMVKDSLNPWYVAFGADENAIDNLQEETKYAGSGNSNSLNYALSIAPGATKTINFVIAGSYVSEEATLSTFNTIKNDWASLLEAKKKRYELLAQQTKLTIPDKKMERTFEWLKYNCDWLVRTVPEIGTGIGAGIPDYPWYFGVDSEYALMGYMSIGQDETVYQTIHLLNSVSQVVNSNGKVIHEMSSNGAVFKTETVCNAP